MSAAVVTGARAVALRAIERPEPAPGQVRVRLEGCGICGSNLAAWEGRPWFSYPMEPGAPGHEGWGVIDAVGPGVVAPAPGTRVAVLSYRAYAEYDVADADAVVPLPDALNGIPFPGEALGCAYNVFRRSEIAPEHTVVVIGIGFLGAVITSLAAAAGARVIAVSRRAFSLDVARDVGASEAIPLAERGAVERRVREITNGCGAERVVEAVGLQEPLDLAGELTAERGRLIIAGYHQDGTRQVNMQLWNWRGIDVINAHERDSRVYIEGMRGAVERVRDGTIDVRRLVTHAYPLTDLADALEAMRTRPDGFLKAVVTA